MKVVSVMAGGWWLGSREARGYVEAREAGDS